MRISLLLQREPFGNILEQTLSRFWTERLGRNVSVHWHSIRPIDGRLHTGTAQTWLVNSYLNAIFVPDADRAIFDPILREFYRSPIWWRRPFQKAYVSAALSAIGAHWLAHAMLAVSPLIPQAQQTLIVGGNHKLRLLDWANRCVYGILKSGFKPIFMQRELAARRDAVAMGLATPKLLSVARNGAWYSEEIVSGTPLNRLADQAQARKALTEALRQIMAMHQATAELIKLSDYIGMLREQIAELTVANPFLTKHEKEALIKASDALALHSQKRGNNRQLATAMAHGDFQPANILLDDKQVWLIDWEYAGRRQMGYDWLVYGLQARLPKGLARRLSTYVSEGLPEAARASALIRSGTTADDVNDRQWQANLFLLEELSLHLAENSQPSFLRSGDGLRTLVNEIAIWTQNIL